MARSSPGRLRPQPQDAALACAAREQAPDGAELDRRTISGQRPGQPEVRAGSPLSPNRVMPDDPVALERQHEHPEEPADRRVRVLDVVAKRGLAVGSRRHQPYAAARRASRTGRPGTRRSPGAPGTRAAVAASSAARRRSSSATSPLTSLLSNASTNRPSSSRSRAELGSAARSRLAGSLASSVARARWSALLTEASRRVEHLGDLGR